MGKFKLPVENFEKLSEILGSRTAGIITNQTCVDSCNRFVLPELRAKLNLKKVFVPEHGLYGLKDGGEKVESFYDQNLDMQVVSLYGEEKKPNRETLEDIQVVFYHVQDLGLRFYTYISTLYNFMEALHEFKSGLEMIILDRPNPLGRAVEGPMLDSAYKSFVGQVPVPIRYGLTIGELAKYLKKKMNWNVNLTVMKMENYKPSEFYGWIDEIPWNPPSSAIKDIETAFLYSGACLLEGTNLSEGRGTVTPFKFMGAPDLNVEEVIDKLKDKDFPVVLEKVTFTPAVSKYKGELCKGIRARLKSYENFYGMEIMSNILHVINPAFTEFFDKLAGTDKLRNAIQNINFDKMIKVLLQDDVKDYKTEIENFYLYK